MVRLFSTTSGEDGGCSHRVSCRRVKTNCIATRLAGWGSNYLRRGEVQTGSTIIGMEDRIYPWSTREGEDNIGSKGRRKFTDASVEAGGFYLI